MEKQKVNIKSKYHRKTIDGKQIKYHRYVWEQNNGKIPEGCVIHHKDGNKHNNDISNLELMTSEEHNKYHNRGENHPKAILSKQDVIEIRTILSSKIKITEKEVSDAYGVSPRTIQNIKYYQTWKHI